MRELPVLTGKELRLFRVFKGFGQKNMASFLNISQPAYSKWENADHLSPEKIMRLTEIFGTELNDVSDFLQTTSKKQ